MAFTLVPGYVWVDGEVFTATKANLAATPTLAGDQTYTFGVGAAATPSINFTGFTTSGFYYVGGLGVSIAGSSVGLFTATGLNASAIGATTPSTGSFTTLAGSGLMTIASSGFFTGRSVPVAGAGLEIFYASNTSSLVSFDRTGSAYKALSLDGLSTTIAVSGSGVATFTATGLQGAIGATTPAAGAFTTLAASGAATITGKLIGGGTTTNDSAGAGVIGEYATANASGALTIGVVSNVTSVSLTAGDWDVFGVIGFVLAGGSTATYYTAAVSTTSATLPAISVGQLSRVFGNIDTTGTALPTPTIRLSLSGTTTVYLVAQSDWDTSTNTAYGVIRARRAR